MKAVDRLTDDEISTSLKQIQEEIPTTEDRGTLSSLQTRERDLITERGRRGMVREQAGIPKRQIDRMERDVIDLLHDIDGTRRSAPLFASHELSRARDLVEEAFEIVARVLAER